MKTAKIGDSNVRECSERTTGIFSRIASAARDEQPLINPACLASDFAVIEGVTDRIDVTQASRCGADGQRVTPEAHPIPDLARGAGKRPAGRTAEQVRGGLEDFAKYRLRSRPCYIGLKL
ncbi:hypothetical protein ACWIEX_07290 [Bosea sp. NPDC055353]